MPGRVAERTGTGLSVDLNDVMAARQLLPTPTVCGNHNRKGASLTSGDGLATAVRKLIPTPTAQDAKNSTLPPSQRGRDSIPGEVIKRQGLTNAIEVTGRQLNPEFVEALMGFPIGWTDVEADGPLPEVGLGEAWQIPPVAKSVPNRVARIKGLGNAVVPQVAEAIGRAIVAHHRAAA
jgi:site-specific DNA-cytosine methylase